MGSPPEDLVLSLLPHTAPWGPLESLVASAGGSQDLCDRCEPFRTSPESKEALGEPEGLVPRSRALLFCLSPSSLLSCIIAYLEMTSSRRLMAKVRFSRRRRASVGSDSAGSMPV